MHVLRSKLGDRAESDLKKELDICQKFKNEGNIVQLREFYKTDHNSYFVFEYCGGGDLRTYLKEVKRLDEFTA